MAYTRTVFGVSFTCIGFSLRLLSVMAPAYTVAIPDAFISHVVVIHDGFCLYGVSRQHIGLTAYAQLE